MNYRLFFHCLILLVSQLIFSQKPSEDDLDKNSCGNFFVDNYIEFEDLESSKAQNFIKNETNVANDFLAKLPGWQSISSKMRGLASRVSKRTYSTKISEKGEYFFLMEQNEIEQLFYKKQYDSKPIKLFSPKEFKPETNVPYSVEYINPSWNGKFVAIALSSEGKEFSEIVVFDVESKIA